MILRSHLALAAPAAGFMLALAGCGEAEEPLGPAGFVPVDAHLYFEVSLESEEQLANAEALTERLGELPVIGSPLDPEDLIQQALDEAGATEGAEVSFAEDIEPWLGDRFGAAATEVDSTTADPDVLIAVEVTDEELARESIGALVAQDGDELEEVELGGVTAQRPVGEEGAYAFLDGFLVLGTTDDAFTAGVEARDGDSIAGTDEFSDAFAELPGERLASAYLDFGIFIEQAAQEDGATEAEIAGIEAVYGEEFFDSSIALTLSASEQTLALDSSSLTSPLVRVFSASELLAMAPADSIGALGLGDVGGQAETLIDDFSTLSEELGEPGLDRTAIEAAFESQVGVALSEATAALGDAVIYVRGEIPDDFVVGTEIALGDPEVGAALLDAVRAQIEQSPAAAVAAPLDGVNEGFSVVDESASGVGEFTNFEIDGEVARILIAPSRESAERPAPAEGLSDSEAFQQAVAALGDGYEPVGYADLAPILDSVLDGNSILDVVTGGASAEQAIAGFVADNLDFAVLGERADDDRLIQRFVVGVE